MKDDDSPGRRPSRVLKMKDDDPPGRSPSRVPPGRPAQNQFRSSRPPARKPVRMQRNQTRSRQETERAQVRATAASNRQSPDYIRRNRRRLDQRRYGKSFDPGYEEDARGLGSERIMYEQDQQWRMGEAARSDQNQRRAVNNLRRTWKAQAEVEQMRERERIRRQAEYMPQSNQSWEEDPDSTEQDREDEQRKRRMEQLNRERQFAARDRERLATKRAAMQAEKERIRNLSPVRRNGAWWKEMYEGEEYNPTWGEMSTNFSDGRRFRRLTSEEEYAWNQMPRRVDSRRTKNNYSRLRF